MTAHAASRTLVVCRSAIESLLDVTGNKQVPRVTPVHADQFRHDRPVSFGFIYKRQSCAKILSIVLHYGGRTHRHIHRRPLEVAADFGVPTSADPTGEYRKQVAEQPMKRHPAAKPFDADTIHWIIVRCFSGSGQLNGLVREHFDLWNEMSHIGRLHHLTRKLKTRLVKSYEWTFAEGKPVGLDLPEDETYKPQNFTGPMSELEQPPETVVKRMSRGPRPRHVMAVGFDARGKPICQMILNQEEWAALNREMRLRFLSKSVSTEVANYQWKYID
jgi:hypothetical protein